MRELHHDSKRIMTAQEVSEYLRIPLSTLYGLSKGGKIRGIKIGKHWRYLEEDIYAYFHGARHIAHVEPSPQIRPGPEYPQPFQERRSHARLNCEIPARIRVLLAKRGEQEIDGTIHNLCANGAFFGNGSDHRLFEVGDPVKIAFEIPESGSVRRIEADGRVIHERESGRFIGLKFRNMNLMDQGAICAYVG
ncbi:MAG: helix-turn-helix domain-containing protein [Candidatus Omnitrophica bacterium]|nr:helix-turn-helix domain-containing protein [Candidatus Omnitrophota bacterium]